MNILVLAGGYSPERDVSLTSGSLIANALRKEGENVCLADVYLGVDERKLNDPDIFTQREGEVYRVTNSIPDLKALKEQLAVNAPQTQSPLAEAEVPVAEVPGKAEEPKLVTEETINENTDQV